MKKKLKKRVVLGQGLLCSYYTGNGYGFNLWKSIKPNVKVFNRYIPIAIDHLNVDKDGGHTYRLVLEKV